MSRRRPLVLFAPNAGPGVGGGHVMRCLAWAGALQARGAEVVFALPEHGRAIVERFAARPTETVEAPDFPTVLGFARSQRPSAVVVDHYAWGAEEESALRQHAPVVAALDDLARPHAASLVLDPSYGRTPADYAGKAPGDARLLLGPQWALLRPAFAERRAAGLAPVRERVERIFVSFGLSDVDQVTARAVRLIRAALPEAAIDVALAGDAGSLPALQALCDPRLALHVDARDVAALLAEADLAIGAGGAATWERCCLGAPTLAVVVADNQRALIERVAAAGVLVGTTLFSDRFDELFDRGLRRLSAPQVREQLRRASLGLTDGRGAERAADALLSALADER